MLLSLSLENWMSFKEKITFSMIATRERQHGDRVTKLDKYQTRVLPIATLYGANASGKTNFFKALSFAKSLIVTGTRADALDRKSTRLNSSHVRISYAVFCLKKKK